jgi:hypothetical protein
MTLQGSESSLECFPGNLGIIPCKDWYDSKAKKFIKYRKSVEKA